MPEKPPKTRYGDATNQPNIEKSLIRRSPPRIVRNDRFRLRSEKIKKSLTDYLAATNKTEMTKERYLQAFNYVLEALPDLELTKANIRGFLAGLQRKGYRTTTLRFYYRFLKSLCENILDKDWPLRRSDFPAQTEAPRKPIFSVEEINQFIRGMVHSGLEKDFLARGVVAIVYGARRIELARLSSADIDPKAHTIKIRTGKHGEVRTQPIPEQIAPYLFNAEIAPITARQAGYVFKTIEKTCKIPHVNGRGFHAIRRRFVTVLRKKKLTKEEVHLFLRWKMRRDIVDEYDVLSPEEIGAELAKVDKKVLKVHPFLEPWVKA